MAKFIQIQRIIEIIFEMKMASFIVPPSLGKHKYVRSPKRRKRQRAKSTDLPPGNFGLDIDGILAAIIPRGIAPSRRIIRSRLRGLHKANQRKSKSSKAF